MAFEEILKIAQDARKASLKAASLGTEKKNLVLSRIANLLLEQKEWIQSENQKDLENAESKGLSKASIDRLMLNENRILDMVQGLKEIVALDDPIGTLVKESIRPNGLKVQRVRIPLGVIGIIYESRPNVTVDAAALCLKSGNVVVLRGGSEAFHSNMALGKILQNALLAEGLDPAMIQVVPTTDREAVKYLLSLNEWIDLIIPRGGPSLMQMVGEFSKIPVVKHDKGNCHLYVDGEADLDQALAITVNAKAQRPGVCNALETLLVDEAIAETFMPKLIARLKENNVIVHGCEKTCSYDDTIIAAKAEDWDAEYLDLILAVKIVHGIDEAIEHIQKHSSLHTEAIVSKNGNHCERFVRELNSSAIMVNASTRFNDGGQLGLGAEIGISTSKLHAFGPMGLEELTTSKFVVRGEGQVRQ